MKHFKGAYISKPSQGMADYGLFFGIVAVAVVAILLSYRTEITDLFQNWLEVLRNKKLMVS